MNIASEPAHSSLAQRIAKVRNCMLVEVATGVSVTDKDLFVSLCRAYEQQSVGIFSLPCEAYKSLHYWRSSISKVTQEATLPSWPISLLSRSLPLWQQGIGFLITNRTDFNDWDDGYSDWTPDQ